MPWYLMVNNPCCRTKPGLKKEMEKETEIEDEKPKKLVLTGSEVASLQLAEDFALPQSVLSSMLQLIDQAGIRDKTGKKDKFLKAGVYIHTAKTQYRKFETNNPRKGIARTASVPIDIHGSVSDLYIPTISLPILLQEKMWTDPGNI
jgi:hypothetical protein